MKPILAIILALAVSTQADIVLDLGELQTVTVTTAQLELLRPALDAFDPPAVNEETGERATRVEADYKPILLKWGWQRGFASLDLRLAEAHRQRVVEQAPAPTPIDRRVRAVEIVR